MSKNTLFNEKPFNTVKLSLRLSLQTGFTLIELILALSILSIIVLLIGSSFRLGMKAWEKGEAETHETQKLRVLSGIMSQNIKSAYPYKTKIDDKEVILFKGENNSLLFVTTLVDFAAGGFKWVRFSYEDGLLMFKEGILPDKNILDKLTGDEEIIESNIEEFEFEYLSSDKSEWLESWDFGDELPSAVKIKVALFQPFLITIPMRVEKKDEENKQKNVFF